MKDIIIIIRPIVLYLLLSVAILLMLTMLIDYSTLKTDIHFLKKKQEYLDYPWWTVSFYIHVFSSVLALAAGLTQFSKAVLTRYRKLHRNIGKMYVINILVINFPTGLVLAIYANGLIQTKLAFLILDCLWFYFTWMAYRAIRKGNIVSHEEFMIRSFALTLSAITLRSWSAILNAATPLDPAIIYMCTAWLGFVPNMLVAEWIIRERRRRKLSLKIKGVFNQYIKYEPREENRNKGS